MVSFKIPVVGREKKSISLLSVFVFPLVNVFLEDDRAGSWYIFGWGRPRDGGEVDSPAVERVPERCSLGGRTTPPPECDFETTPHLNVILRGPTEKSLQWAQNSYQQHWEQSRFQAHPQFITLYLPPDNSFLTVTRLKSFTPHGAGRFSTGSSQTSPSSPGHRWCLQCPMSGLFLPYQENVYKIFS